MFVLGDDWRGAIVLLGGLAVAVALQQVGYSWFAFYRARGQSWPQAVESGVLGASFVLLAVPGALLWGSWGFVGGRIGCTLCVLGARSVYVRRLLPGARLLRVAARACVPVALATVPVLALRLALWGGERPLWQAVVGAGDLAGRARVGDLALRADPAGRAARVPAVKATLLWLAAALISGFTLRRYLGPLDEGVLMQAASRMAEGQLPWRDFSWAYGPGQPLAVLVFGDSLLSWRFLRVGADATTAVLVWALVRDVKPRWALPAWLAAAVTTAQPTSANPTAPALAFALAAVLCATKGRAAWAGGFAALAAFWRPDVGVIAALAAAAVFVGGGATAHERAARGGAGRRGRAGRRGCAGAAARRGGGEARGAARRAGGAAARDGGDRG